MSFISSQYLSQTVISKLKLLHKLDVMLTSSNPAGLTSVPFEQLLQAYSDSILEMLHTDLLNYYDCSHECVINVCMGECIRAQPEFEENWRNVHEDLLNRIRYGDHEHLYQYYSSNRFDNLYLHMEQVCQSPITQTTDPLPLQQILDNCSAAFLALTTSGPDNNSKLTLEDLQ